MENSAVNAKIDVEDGTYDALWSAYNLRIFLTENRDEWLEARTHVGVKGINCPVRVRITSGDVEFID